MNKVYLMITSWSGWEDPEANGCSVKVFDSKNKAIACMEEMVEQEIKQEKEYGREFHETTHLSQYVEIVSQYSERVEFEVLEKEIK